jgi:hypothetical protein
LISIAACWYLLKQTLVRARDEARRRHGEHEDDGGHAQGGRGQDGERTGGGRHALAAPEPEPDRVDVPEHGGDPGRDGRQQPRREQLRHEHGDRALDAVEDHRDGGRAGAGRAQDVGRTDVAAAGTAQVHAPLPRQEEGERDRSHDVRQHDGEELVHDCEPSARGPAGANRRRETPSGSRTV